MKLTHVELSPEVRIVELNNSGSHLDCGMACTPAYGGGRIVSMEYKAASLYVRKDGKFVGNRQGKPVESDVVVVPWANVRYATGIDDAETAQQQGEPPIAKAIQQQPRGK